MHRSLYFRNGLFHRKLVFVLNLCVICVSTFYVLRKHQHFKDVSLIFVKIVDGILTFVLVTPHLCKLQNMVHRTETEREADFYICTSTSYLFVSNLASILLLTCRWTGLQRTYANRFFRIVSYIDKSVTLSKPSIRTAYIHMSLFKHIGLISDLIENLIPNS